MTPESNQTNMHLTVAAVVERQGRFLMVEERVHGKRVLNQPAGHVENGENFVQAVVRETREETAWDFHPDAITGIYRWVLPDNGACYFRHCFCGAVTDHRADQALDTGILQTIWYSYAELQQRQAQLRSPLVLKCIEDYHAGVRLPLSLYQDVK